jgi:hypothetical protein
LSFIFVKIIVFVIGFVGCRVSPKMAYNGLGLGEVGEFEKRQPKFSTNV